MQPVKASSDPPAPFVVGVPRSGTTLLRFMLNAHPDLALPPETWFVPRAARLRGRGDALREALVEVMVGCSTWPDMEIDEPKLRAELGRVEPFTVADGLRAFYALHAAREGKVRYGDKTPVYSEHMATIEKLLPEARFVHIIRDGRDVAVSVRPLPFAPGRDIETLARDWRGRIIRARRAGGRREHYLELHYEDLVADPGRELRRVATFLDLPYDNAMERWHEAPWEPTRHAGMTTQDGRRVISESRRHHFARAASPLDRRGIGRFHGELSADEQAAFERVAGDLLAELGYQVDRPSSRRWLRSPARLGLRRRSPRTRA
jgi:hypothetical protein